jgi:hypothetical protein
VEELDEGREVLGCDWVDGGCVGRYFEDIFGLELCEVLSDVIGMWNVCYFSRDTSCLCA